MLIGGVGSYGSYPRYYNQMYFTGNYPTYVNQAVSSWMSSLSSVSLYETDVAADSVIDIANYYSGAGNYGITYFYNGSTQLVLDALGHLPSNYAWVRINVSISSVNASGMPETQKQAVIAHELGHAFGLSHRLGELGTIMNIYNHSEKPRNVWKPTNSDFETLRHLYG